MQSCSADFLHLAPLGNIIRAAICHRRPPPPLIRPLSSPPSQKMNLCLPHTRTHNPLFARACELPQLFFCSSICSLTALFIYSAFSARYLFSVKLCFINIGGMDVDIGIAVAAGWPHSEHPQTFP